MNKRKKFDGVQMKHDIQQQILQEIEGLTLAERRRTLHKKIAADPILGPWWKRTGRTKPGQKVEEKKTRTR